MGTTVYEITYYEPIYGARTFRVIGAAKLVSHTTWLDAGGYVYHIHEIRER